MHYVERITWTLTLETSRGCGAYAGGNIIQEESGGVFSFTERKLFAAFRAFTGQQPNQRHPCVDHAHFRPAPCLMGETL